MHITCCACAYQLLCKRTTAVVRPEILTNSKTYTIFSNNLYYAFQQPISNFPTKKGESLTYDTPCLLNQKHITDDKSNLILKIFVHLLGCNKKKHYLCSVDSR